MKIEINTMFKIVQWNEVSFSEIEGGGKLTKASIIRTFDGDLKGESKLEYLMVYGKDGSAVYTGFERITGQIKDKSGSFVLRHEGDFKEGIAEAECKIIPDSGTEELQNLKGTGYFKVGHSAENPMKFELEL